VSEAAPGFPDPPGFATAERARAAQAVRGLIDVLMSADTASAAALDAAAEVVERLTVSLGGDRRQGTAGYAARSHDDYLPRSPVVGDASPLSPRLDWEVVDDRVHARGRFGAAYEGPPGYVHGGVVALAFDEVLGIANIVNGSPGMTATLTVRYRRPMPLLADVRFVAWVERVDGRRIVSHAEAWNGETRCAEAEGLFVQPRPEIAAQYFGPRPGS
jgi:acyl-coenzyme A thioesterase PaaI-like protein